MRQTRKRASAREEEERPAEDEDDEENEHEQHVGRNAKRSRTRTQGASTKRVQASASRIHPGNIEEALESEELENATVSEGGHALGDGEDDIIEGGNLELDAIVKLARKTMNAPPINQVPLQQQRDGYLDEYVAKEIVSRMMRFILFLNMSRQKCTTKKIKENVKTTKDIKLTPGSWNALLAICVEGFKDAFGYDLVCTAHAPLLRADVNPNKKPPKKKSAPKTTKEGADAAETARSITSEDHWILLNLTETAAEKRKLWKDLDDNDQRGVLLTVLALIMMHEGSIQEPKLVHILVENMGLPAPPERSQAKKAAAGSREDSLSIIRNLEHEAYLVRRKTDDVNAENEPIYNVTYGPKAVLEIGLPNVLRFITKVGGLRITDKDVKVYLGTVE